ncbi:glycosyl hydrolase catalytic core-domain-containing protein [Neurospora hispaniola]|uniref:Glycosyl hydrolase catalytic core-domain-containing protein n=2 Tax=Neurospora hispaniola TaxID=588809 RepID=A0AAJ0I5T1_9PEZI|nr:glycosyl hydrolase catalytic core-domain-containing protein [Neurospora hispaniola]
MWSQSLIALAAATFAGETLAASIHRGHEHHHVGKRDMVTQMVTRTAWTTVTVTLGQSVNAAPTAVDNNTKLTKSRSPSSSTAVAAPAEASSAAPSSNTIAHNVNVVDAAASPSATQNSAPAAAPSTTTTVESTEDQSSGHRLQRGLAYNDGKLLQGFLGSGSKATWVYNWGQVDDSGTGLEFVPMLWGVDKGFPQSWDANAQKAIDAGSKAFLSFNEPDLSSQSNMSPQDAAANHIKYMNPWAGKVRISSPSITNSDDPNMGLNWMQKFFDACNGQCKVDFLALHSYGTDGPTVLNHLLDAYSRFKKPVWVTELGFDGDDDKKNQAMEYVLDHLENNSTFSFVERFTYFMVAEGEMLRNSQLTTFAKTFAYGA